MHRRIVLPAILGTLALLTGCGSPAAAPTPPAGVVLTDADPADGNGLWLQDGAEATAIVTSAVRAAGPVHVTGALTETVQPDPRAEPHAGRSVTIDFRGTAAAYSATLTAGDVQVQAVVSPDGSRVRGNAGFARENPGREIDQVVCTTGLDPILVGWAPVLDPAELISALLSAAGVSADPPVGDTDTIEVVVGEEGSVVGVLSVERFGAPLPRGFVAADGSGEGTLTFAEWGQPVDLPAAAADLPCPEHTEE